jgi:NAD(P)-dependent dehydrogenase (short-subunit alcohol dehydrogenase family)
MISDFLFNGKYMFDLNDKVILVVGGRGFLGRDFCHHLNKQNATVISADVNTTSITASKSNSGKGQDGIKQIDMDVTNPASISAAVKLIIDKYNKIDVLIYSASAKPDDFYMPFTDCSLEGWQKVINIELDGAFLVTKEVGKVMEKQQNGSIVFLSSIYGVVGNDQRIYEDSNLDSVYLKNKNSENNKIYSHSVYPVVKGGLISLSRYLAAYWGEKNIRVNCISPGGISHESENETFVSNYSYRVPLGRKALPEEISSAVVFLSSDEASYINGQNIIVDGGWTAW